MDQIAVVTGANRGLGLEASHALAKQGVHVILTSRDIEKAKRATQDWKDLSFECMCLDVGSDASVRDFAAAVTQKHGKLDILVNNAGVFLETRDPSKSELTTALDVPPEIVAQTFNTNTLGPYRLIQALAPLMKKKGYGRIVNVSSGMGALTDMGGSWPGYRLSKSALNALTRIFSEELGEDGIKVNSVCPGWVRTDMGGSNATRSLAEGADTIAWAALLPEEGPNGVFLRDKKVIPW